MKKPKPWGVRVLLGGVPTYLNHKPSRAMLHAMSQAHKPDRWTPESQDEFAIAYASWLARRDGLAVPELGRDVRTRIVRDWTDAGTRIREVIWETGYLNHYETRRRFRKGKEFTEEVYVGGSGRWVSGDAVLTVPIPNWDHVPSCTMDPDTLSQRELYEMTA